MASTSSLVIAITNTVGGRTVTNSLNVFPTTVAIAGNGFSTVYDANGLPTVYSIGDPSHIGTIYGTEGRNTAVYPDGSSIIFVNGVANETIAVGGKTISSSASTVTSVTTLPTNVISTSDSISQSAATSLSAATSQSGAALSSSAVALATGVLYQNGTLVESNGTQIAAPVTQKKATPQAGLGPGPSAGLAIGMLIAGAIIAGLICFLFFFRRNKRNAAHAGHYEQANYTTEHDLKHPTVVSTPMAAAGAAAIIENNLPQPKEDKTIIDEFSYIKTRIDSYVESYYHTAGANNLVVAQAVSAALGNGFPVPMTKLQELLSNPRYRPAVLRAAIAWIIVSRIQFNSSAEETFLPTYLAGATRDLTASRMDEPTRVAFLSKWRQITAALSGTTFIQEIPADDPRLVNISSALKLADKFLRPCAKDENNEKRLTNLEEIMKRAARFGFLLFSQPSSFHFDWAADGSGLVVFPGLLQTSDDDGKPVPAPRVFGQNLKEVVPVPI